MDKYQIYYDYANSKLKGDNSGHGMDHIMRVLDNAMKIYQSHKKADEEVVVISVLVHDVIDQKLFENPELELQHLIEFLNEHLSTEKTNKIVDIITNMSYSSNKPGYFKDNIEGMIVQDADRIDALGSLGIIRTLMYGFDKQRDISESIDHFDDKLLKLDKLLNLEVSLEIARPKMKIIQDFYDDYKATVGAERKYFNKWPNGSFFNFYVKKLNKSINYLIKWVFVCVFSVKNHRKVRKFVIIKKKGGLWVIAYLSVVLLWFYY